MKSAVILLSLIVSIPAFAKFAGHSGCAATSVGFAEDGLKMVKQSYLAGTTSEVDIVMAQIHLLEIRYCAGDTDLPTPVFCGDDAENSKIVLLENLLALRTQMFNAGTLSQTVLVDSKAQLAEARAFCTRHKNDGL